MTLKREQIKAAFDLFDCDQSGQLDASEVKLLLRGIGFADLSEQELKAMLKAMDTDGSGAIQFEEFEKLVTKKVAPAGSPEEVWRAFKLFDKDSKGRISLEDLRRIAALDKSITEDELKTILKYAAADPNKGITFEEWKLTIAAAQKAKSRS